MKRPDPVYFDPISKIQQQTGISLPSIEEMQAVGIEPTPGPLNIPAEPPLPEQPEVTITTPIPIYNPLLGFIKPEITVSPGQQPEIEQLFVTVPEILEPSPEPEPMEIIQPVTPVGILDPKFGEEISEVTKQEYVAAIEKVPAAPAVVQQALEFKFPDLGDIGKYIGYGLLALAGIYLAGKVLGRKK
jgi:hypothetical protein